VVFRTKRQMRDYHVENEAFNLLAAEGKSDKGDGSMAFDVPLFLILFGLCILCLMFGGLLGYIVGTERERDRQERRRQNAQKT